MIITIEGRAYELRIDPLNCDSQRHRHPEPHADGTPSEEPHHHHSARCGDLPRQATLLPAWEPAQASHVHDYAADGTCACGAWRQDLGQPDNRRRPGESRPRYRIVGYHNPADPAHPEGWSYERREPLEAP